MILGWRPQKRRNSTLKRVVQAINAMTHPPSAVCVTQQEYRDLHIDLYQSSQIGPICQVHGTTPYLMVRGVRIICT